ncbi:MAG TPA: MarR family winged helix-turn-helix transcriptional regulator [Caulobacteraceae bacterium]|nr:MarR family winged helix-turn-helix transcriptional regulator [Caulobacteraceae bacterium]
MAKSKGKASSDVLAGSATHLLHRALQIALDYHADAAGDGGLTQRQFAVLAAAGAAEGLTQSDLVRATGIDRSTLADLVARMIRKGLLERERSTVDARANSVRLSEAGRVALAAGAGPAADADARFLGLLSPKKRETFVKMLASLSEAAAEPPAARRAKAEKPAKSDKKKKKKIRKATAKAA